MKTQYAVPHINVKFTSVENDSFEATNIEFGGDIISLSTNKNFESPAGTFTIQMIAKNDYSFLFRNKLKTNMDPYNIFRPVTLVDIYINDTEVMLGIIDQITKSSNFRSEKPKLSITITGRDMGAFLTDHQIWSNKLLAGGRTNNQTLTPFTELIGSIGGKGISEMIMEIFNNWLIKVVNQNIPGKENAKFRFADLQQIHEKLIALTENKSRYAIWQNYDLFGKKITTGKKFFENMEIVFGVGCLSDLTYGDYYPSLFNVWNYQGNLFEALKALTSYPFNELYIETGGANIVLGSLRDGITGNPKPATIEYSSKAGVPIPTKVPAGIRVKTMNQGKAYLVLRPSPFDDADIPSYITDPRGKFVPWNMDSLLSMQDLISYKVDDSIIVEKSLTLSKNEISSFYHVFPGGAIAAATGGNKYLVEPEYDERVLRRYGYNPREVKLDGLDVYNKLFKDEGFTDICKKYQRKLKSWYRYADRLLTGSMTIKGSEKVRIGNRLDYVRLGDNIFGSIADEYQEGHYYIVGVHHSYTYGVNFETELELDRGVSKKIMRDLEKELKNMTSWEID